MRIVTVRFHPGHLQFLFPDDDGQVKVMRQKRQQGWQPYTHYTLETATTLVDAFEAKGCVSEDIQV